MALPKPSQNLPLIENYRRFGLAIDAIDGSATGLAGLLSTVPALIARAEQNRLSEDLKLQDAIARDLNRLAKLEVLTDAADKANAAAAADAERKARLSTILPGAGIDRPGDAPSAFTNAIAAGAPEDLPALTLPVAVASGGLAAVMRGETRVVMRRKVAVLPGRTYLVWAEVERYANAADPSDDAVDLRLVCFDKARNPLPPGSVLIEQRLSLTSSEGRQILRGYFATAAGTDIKAVLPGTGYVSGELRTYGGTHTTHATVLTIVDVTDAALFSPDLSALTNDVGGLLSQNAGPRLDAVEQALVTPRSVRARTWSDASSITVPNTATVIDTLGRRVAGDIGAARYIETANPPAGAATITSGARKFVLSVDRPCIQHFDGFDDGGDIAPAIAQARAHLGAGGRLRIPRADTGSYYLDSLPAGWTDLFYEFEDGVTISSAFSPPNGFRFSGNVVWKQLADNFSIYLSPRAQGRPFEKIDFINAGDFVRSKVVALDCRNDVQNRRLAWPSGAASEVEPSNAVPGQPRYTSYPALAGDGYFHFSADRYPKHGDKLSFLFQGGAAPKTDAGVSPGLGNTIVGAMLECTRGFALIYATEGNSVKCILREQGVADREFTVRYQADEVDIADQSKRTKIHYGHFAEWTLQLSPTSALVALNRIAIQTIPLPGILKNAGSVVYAPDAAERAVHVDGWTKVRGGRSLPRSYFRIGAAGDSRTAYGSWGQESWLNFFVRAFNGTMGNRIAFDQIYSYAVPGDTSADQLADMRADNFAKTNTDVFVIDVGANDVQGQIGLNNTEANIRAMLAGILSPIVFLVKQCVFYRADTGQATGNQQNGAAYRSMIERIAGEFNVRLIDEAEIYGVIDPAKYSVDTRIDDPIYRDNIHFDGFASLLKGRAVAAAVASVIALPADEPTDWIDVPADFLASNVSFGNATKFQIAAGGHFRMVGNLNITNPANGAVVLTLPPILRPAYGGMTFEIASGNSSTPLRGEVSVGDGGLRLYNVPAGLSPMNISLCQVAYPTY